MKLQTFFTHLAYNRISCKCSVICCICMTLSCFHVILCVKRANIISWSHNYGFLQISLAFKNILRLPPVFTSHLLTHIDVKKNKKSILYRLFNNLKKMKFPCGTSTVDVSKTEIMTFLICMWEEFLCNDRFLKLSFNRFRYVPRVYYECNAELKRCIDQIEGDSFAPAGTFQHIVDELLYHDRFVHFSIYLHHLN